MPSKFTQTFIRDISHRNYNCRQQYAVSIVLHFKSFLSYRHNTLTQGTLPNVRNTSTTTAAEPQPLKRFYGTNKMAYITTTTWKLKHTTSNMFDFRLSRILMLILEIFSRPIWSHFGWNVSPMALTLLKEKIVYTNTWRFMFCDIIMQASNKIVFML